MQLADGVRLGTAQGFMPITTLPFYILVGVTGVGKTTTLEALRAEGVTFSSLPDRRKITDAAIFGGEVVKDREARFAKTAAYRQAHPGGMAEALEQVYVQLPEPILFDGLRGLNEVQHAATVFPKARFIVLDAPDIVRVERLLGRGDKFDSVQRTSLRQITGLERIFSPEEIVRLEQNPHPELGEKVKIVVTERQNYNPKTTNAFLQSLEGNRVLYLDTTLEPPAQIALRIKHWMQR
ncbi:MAG: AAA family ATPase [Deinococcales bacterium]